MVEEPSNLDNPVITTIRSRRSSSRSTPEVPGRRVIETILDAGTWAPNHYKTAPWRFVVLTGKGRDGLGSVMAASLERGIHASGKVPNDREELAVMLEKERRKPLRSSVVIAVGCEPTNGPKVEELEEICAVAAGVQNMLLAAVSLGLGAMWRTGPAARDPEVKRYLGFSEETTIVAFVYLGFPSSEISSPTTRNHAPHTVWLDGAAG